MAAADPGAATDGPRGDGPRVLLCVTGGIAAYKAALVARLLVQRGADVSVLMTEAATRFVGPDTFAALTRNAVHHGVFERPETVLHVRLAHGADAAVVAPATANVLAKLALGLADDLVTATVAPELPGAKEFAIACRNKGVRTNVGHSWATFDQMTEAVAWGVRHVDHLYCAMSDKSKLRQFQMYPMQGGVLEATLYYDELTTEVIADGKHLDAGLLQLALKFKGPDKLALVTDCSRALDMPDGGEYLIGPRDGGEPFIKRDGVGMLPDGSALASSVAGMDHMVRTFQRLTGRPLYEVIRMASLTAARIAGRDSELGSLEPGKRADVLVLDRDLNVKRVFVDGMECGDSSPL